MLRLLSLLSIAVAGVIMAEAGFAYAQSAQPDGADDDDIKFLSPEGITVHNNGGYVFVADTGNHRVQVFDANGTLNYTFGTRGSGEGELLFPGGVGVTRKTLFNKSMVAVADTGNHRISVWHTNGTFAFNFGSEGSGEGEFRSPGGVAMYRAGWLIAVADTGNHRVQIFWPNGTFYFAFGSEGSGEGEFRSPGGVAFDHSQQLFVADTGNNRLQELAYTGVSGLVFTFDTLYGPGGYIDARFDSPRSITSSWGKRVVADTGNNSYKIVGSSVRTYGPFTSDGSLSSPGGAAFGDYSRIYVADTGNHRIAVFKDGGTFEFAFGSMGNVSAAPAGNGTAPPPSPPPPAGNGTAPPPSPPLTCSASLGMPNLDVRVRPGDYSSPVKQVVSNSGTAPFASVTLAASTWRADGGGASAAAVLPASATEVSRAGADGPYAPLVSEMAVAGDLVPRDDAHLWFRLNLTPYGGMQAGDTIIQHVTYNAECRLPP